MTKNNRGNKDIYEIFNDIEFYSGEFEPVEMDEVEIARMKKIVRKKIKEEEAIKEVSNEKNYAVKNKKKNRKWLKIASIALAIAVTTGFTPRGREVLAQIADKLFFNPSQGIMNEGQWGNTYVLEEPVRVSINGESTLIKNIINSGDYITIEMWISEEANESNPNWKEEYEEFSNEKLNNFKENFKIRTMNGKDLSVEGFAMASGGYTSISFKQDGEIITEFDLYYGNEEVGHFTLNQVKYVEDYDELGGNATNNGILIGATSYFIEGERYFKLWSNKDEINLPEYTMRVDSYNNIKVTDDEGNPLRIESANDGTGKAYKILDEYKGNIHISISEIELSYQLREGGTISLKLPKKGEILEVNKEVKLKGLKERIVVKSIKKNNGQYENGDYVITLDYSNNYDINRFIYMARQSFRSGGNMGDFENKYSEMYLDEENLYLSEKIQGRINLKLDNISVIQYGNWEFQIN